jgi:hypothetical protein
VLSIFAFPKPFRGHIGVIQRNAIGSWKQLRPQCEIFLFGDEEGTAEVARELGVNHVSDIARNEFGTPLLSDVFEKGAKLATHNIHCYVNCDIILGESLIPVIQQVARWRPRFLVVGRCWDMDIKAPIAFQKTTWENELGAILAQRPSMRGEWAIDYFVFPRGLYGELPPFALGRAKFDNWLVWKAGDLKVPVVDATPVLTAIHQNHDYSHVAGGKDYTLYGEEAIRNEQYAGGPEHCYGICHATHKFLPGGIRRNWGRYRLQLDRRLERMKGRMHPLTVRMERMKLRLAPTFWRVVERTRPIRHALGLHGRNLSRLRNLYRKNG